jgi:DNA-binding ferritin-like protein (Dps family)
MSDTRKRKLWARFTDYVAQTRRDKREFRQYKTRAAALPPEYRMVMKKIQSFLWSASGAVDDQSWKVLCDICEVFEEASAAGRPVLEVTGDDVAAFSLNMLAATQAKTWADQKAAQLNAEVHKLLEVDNA